MPEWHITKSEPESTSIVKLQSPVLPASEEVLQACLGGLRKLKHRQTVLALHLEMSGQKL